MFSRRQLARALPVAVTGALALVGVTAGTASGVDAGATSSCVTGGEGTILMSQSYINHMLSHNVSITPLGTSSTVSIKKYDSNSTTNKYTTTNYYAVGGNADLSTSTGVVQYSGGILVMNTFTGKKLILDNIMYDAASDMVYYTLAGATTGFPGGFPLGTLVPVFNMGDPEVRTIDGNTQSYSSSKLLVSEIAANAMDAYLDTNVFHAGDVMGPGFRTTFTTGPCA